MSVRLSDAEVPLDSRRFPGNPLATLTDRKVIGMYVRLMIWVAALAMGVAPATAEYRLTVLHTNDFHSRFEPISKYDSGCSAEDNSAGKCFGGSARLVTAVEEARRRAGNNILVDGGDQFQGSLFYTYYKGKAAAEMMNRMGYDAMTVGNHEFDDGPEVLRGFVNSVNFPILMSNAEYSAEPFLADVIRKSVVIERGGERLGLIGLTPVDTHDTSSPGGNITFTDPVAAVQEQVDILEAEGINKIIVLSHSGYPVDRHVAANTEGVDVIVGGHDNTYLSNTSESAKGPYPTMVGTTAIVHAYAYGKFLGELNVSFDDRGVITEAVGEPIIMDVDIAEDPGTKARIGELAVPLDEVRNRVVARAGALINGDRAVCRVMECPMGNLLTDAMLERVMDQGIQIAFANSGGIRASFEAGDVTMGDVLTVLPFQNTLSTFRINGQGIIDALENGVSQVEEVNGRFPQVAGLSFVWDPSVAPGEGRIKEVLVAGRPIDPDAIYGVVTNNFVRGGGDGYKVFAAKATDAYDYGPDLADVLAEYIAGKDEVTAALHGRIATVE